ncbi:MAG: hypothetical protein ABSH35_30510 [Isosphaeraceae bacterium]
MDPDELTHLLDAVAAGALSTADAVLRIRTQPYVDAGGFAKVDLHRRVRCGFPEVIFGQGKTAQQIEAILRALVTHGQGGLVTRVAGGRGPSPVGVSGGPAQPGRPHVPDRKPGGRGRQGGGTTRSAARSGSKARRPRAPRWGGWSSSRRGRATCPWPRRLASLGVRPMIEHGIIGEDEPVWLFEGVIVWKGAPRANHAAPEIAATLEEETDG